MDSDSQIEKERLIQYKKLPLVGLLISVIGISFVIIAQTPERGPVVVMIFLLLLFIGYMAMISLVIQVTRSIFAKKSFSWTRLLYTSVALAGGAIFLTGLQTLRQLQSIDVILVLVFELVLNFYLLRRF